MSAVARRYFVRGRELLRRGAWDDAARELSAAIELSPTFFEARIGLALAVVRTDPPRAAQILRVGLQRAVRATERRALGDALGDVLLLAGDFPGADAAYREAAAIPGPLSPARHDRLARLHAKAGRFTEALTELAAAARK